MIVVIELRTTEMETPVTVRHRTKQVNHVSNILEHRFMNYGGHELNNKRANRVLTDLSSNHPLLNAIDEGVDPLAIKAAVIECLAPYFLRQDLLEEIAVEVLTSEFIRVTRIKHDPWMLDAFEATLNMYRRSAAAGTECFKIFDDWWREVEQGAHGFWSLYNLRTEKELALEDFVFERFSFIGSLLEGVLQPMLRELLSHARYVRGRDWNPSAIRKLDFGLVVGELHDTSQMKTACSPPPWMIRLNHWRNIAKHHDFNVRQQDIFVTHGKQPNTTTRQLTVDDIELLMRRILGLFEAIGCARSLFAIDNHEQFTIGPSPNETRLEGRLVHLSSTFASQGFKLVDVIEQSGYVEAIVQDALEADAKARAAHASQFVVPLWVHFRRERLVVRFFSRLMDREILCSAKGVDCELVGKGSISLPEFANRVTFTVIK